MTTWDGILPQLKNDETFVLLFVRRLTGVAVLCDRGAYAQLRCTPV